MTQYNYATPSYSMIEYTLFYAMPYCTKLRHRILCNNMMYHTTRKVQLNYFLGGFNWIFVSQPRPLRTKVVRAPKLWALTDEKHPPRSEAGSRKFTEYQKIGGAAKAIF